MNAIKLLTTDHRSVERLFADFEAADPGARQPIVADIIKELSIHAAIEEAYLYGVVRSEIDGGERLVEDSEKEHQRVKEMLARLDRLYDKAHTVEVAELVKRLEEQVAHHVREEEDVMFAALERDLPRTRLKQIGRELRDAKQTAPTRPHPNQPPATELTGRVNAAVDHVRDRLSGR